MRWNTPAAAALLALLTLIAPAQAQLPDAERKILEQSAETYRRLQSYLLAGVIQVDVKADRGPQSQQAPFLVASDGKGRIRDEVRSGPSTGLFVSDGKQTVIYNGTLEQYIRKTGNADSALKQFPNKGVGGMIIARYSALTQGASQAKRLPDETLTVNGVSRPCHVLDVTYQAQNPGTPVREDPRRYWIDRETHLVIRQRTALHADAPQYGGKVDQEEVINFHRAAINPPFPDSLWAFRAPPGSREVDEFKSSAADMAASFTGKPAIDFTLKDLKGRSHSLKALRGKTVLLDFWATWCGPCRMTMPQVAKIHEQYKDKGVEVMSINEGESAEKAGAYLAKNGYAFTALLDTDRSVATQYKVNGIPTLVVIDREGKISDYLVGARDEAALQAALKKAGVK